METWKLIVAFVVLGGFCVAAAIFSANDDKQIAEECKNYREFINN